MTLVYIILKKHGTLATPPPGVNGVHVIEIIQGVTKGFWFLKSLLYPTEEA